MLASFLLDTCLEAGIDFFTGVPDSYLSGLCNELFTRYGTDQKEHIVAHNEGGAVALCAGHYLATGRPALCYMQNSGLGNAINPLASLTDPGVYGIPLMLVIGWRGEPGQKDEPQHITQGAITLRQLELMDIPYAVLSPETTEAAFLADFQRLRACLDAGRCVAVVARKGSLKSLSSPSYANRFSLSREKAAEVLLSFTGEKDVIVSTTGKLSREIFELREQSGHSHQQDFLTVGSMGHASMIALRIAEECPERTVWCLDGDGAMMMHLGSLPLIGRRRPSNFNHVVINNGAHETVGGMPVCSGKLNIHALACASGYTEVLQADSEHTLAEALNEWKKKPGTGPRMLEIRCACGARSDLGRPTTTPIENRDALMQFITKSSQF